MPMINQDLKVARVMNAVAAGTTDQNSSSVDMVGFDGVKFIAAFGALTATQVTSIYAQHSDDNSAWADCIGSRVGPLADGDGNKCLAVTIHKPQKRYVRCVVDRGTANAVIDGVIALQYGPSAAPAVNATSVAAAEGHLSPATGTP